MKKRYNLTTQYVLVITLLLLVADILLGIVMLSQSKSSMQALIRKNMLDITNSAAGMMDGDALGALTEEDVGGEVFSNIARELTVFRANVDIRYIYAVRQAGEDRFVFTVDPDPVNPGEFGEDVVVTQALISAGKGVAAVDSAPAADEWGNFYSAYSPVFDSEGNVAGIIGVDFDVDWYESQVRRFTMYIGVITLISVIGGGLIVLLISNRLRRNIGALDAELSALAADVDQLTEEIVSSPRFQSLPRTEAPTRVGHDMAEIEVLGDKISAMRAELLRYFDYLHVQAYTDALTQVGNSAAYHERLHALEDAIKDGSAAFSVAVLDINGLKEINDTHGHEYGDLVIRGAADALTGVFAPESIFRIGGDEFAVICGGCDGQKLREKLAEVDAGIAAFNAAPRDVPVKLAVAKGLAAWRGGEDRSFRDVFTRADEAMYEDKRAYYQRFDRRRRSVEEEAKLHQPYVY